MSRTVWRSVRFSSTEAERVSELARRSGLPTSTYIREAALQSRGVAPRAPRTRRVRFREPRTHRCEVRFHTTEWERVVELARTLDLPPARFVREVAVGYQLTGRVNALAVWAVNRVGVNLNRLTKIANATHELPAQRQLEEVLTSLNKALARLL